MNVLKVFYHLTEGPKYERIYKREEPFCIKYPLEPNQTYINLILINRILSREINICDIAEIRYFNKTKKGLVKITNKTSFPIDSGEIQLQIQLKDLEPKELLVLKRISNKLESKIELYEKIKTKIKSIFNKERIDLYFLYAFPLEESQKTEKNSIISYHLEIAKLVDIFKSSKKSFNAIFECATVQKLKDAIREQPKIMHISCHGSNPENGYSLKFEERGAKRNVPEKELEEILSKLSEKLKNIDLVFLSSCHSQVAGELFLKYGVKNVIYINKEYPISNTASLNFAISLYQKLIDCNNTINSFAFSKKELYKLETKSINHNSKCCCNVHKHSDKCCLNDEKTRMNLHRKFHEKKCDCNFEEFCLHRNTCEIYKLISRWNSSKKHKKKFIIDKIGNDISKICCGCNQNEKDLHHIGESYKFKFANQDEKCGEIVIYEDNRPGIFKKNRNCFIVTDKEMYRDNFLLLIGRRDKVKEIYDIIEENVKTPFIIIYGDVGVGRYNFAKSVCVYLFERNVITKYYKEKVMRFDIIKEEIRAKINKKMGEKYSFNKYVFILEIDNRLETPLNLLQEIINEESILDQKFYFFVLLRTKKDELELQKNQEKTKLIHLENLTEPKALQLIMELKYIYNYKKDYLTEEQKKELIRLINNSRKEMLPLLQLIEEHNNFEELRKIVSKKIEEKEIDRTNKRLIMGSKAGKIIFLLNIMDKGLPSSILKLFEPEFETIIKEKNIENYFYDSNHFIYKIYKEKINDDDIIDLISINVRREWLEKYLEVFAKILFYYNRKLIVEHKHKIFKLIDIEYYFNYFFENKGFWKTFNNDIYEACFIKNENYLGYDSIVNNSHIKIEDIRANLYNLLELYSETISDIYCKSENMKEYIEQIIILLPKLFIKRKYEFEAVLDKCKSIINKIKYLDMKNVLRINLFYILLKETDEINFEEFNSLDKEAKAYAYFINGLKINENKLYHKKKLEKYNQLIEKEKCSFEKSLEFFNNNTMKAYCYNIIGNLEYEQKNYLEAEKNYYKGKSFSDIDKFVKGLLNLKIARLIIDNMNNKNDNNQKFNEVINELMETNDIWLINEAKKLQKETKAKICTDIIFISSNLFIKQDEKIQDTPKSQYYLMDKIYNNKNINDYLVIKYKDLNEDNLRESFSEKGKILIIQSDDFDYEDNTLDDSDILKSYSLLKEYFSRVNNINYDILILCFINSGKLINLLKNKVKYLITFSKTCSLILKNKGIPPLEFNKYSIDFLENFITNIIKEDVKDAFEKAYAIFKTSFKNFRKQKRKPKNFKIKNFITLTINPLNKSKKWNI